MDNIPGWETNGLRCDDQTLFPPAKATDKSSLQIWRQARRFLLFPKFNLGLCFLDRMRVRGYFCRARGPVFTAAPEKLDNLAAV